MKFLKKILIIIIAFILIVLTVALFVDGKYNVTREITINKSNQEVFDYIKYLKNQNNFSVWAKMDPNMKKTYKGTDGKIGFISAWDSKNENVGKGEQELVKINEGKRLDFELRFKEPFEANDHVYMTTTKISESKTKVVWGFNGEMNYPMNIMCLFMDMDEMLGKDLSKGLENLKVVLEKNL